MGAKGEGSDLVALLEKLQSDGSNERLNQVHRNLESRVMRLTDQLNSVVHERRALQLKNRRVNGSIKLAELEVPEEQSLAGLDLNSPSSPFATQEESLILQESTLRSLQTSLPAGPSTMTVGTFEAQKVRIQNTIELQLDKALEEERLGMTYKQVLRRMKDELTVLKKNAEDMRRAVEEYGNAMQQEKLRLRAALQSRREAHALWQDVVRIRDEGRNVWTNKIHARERVADMTARDREGMEHSRAEREKARKRAQALARRELQVMTTAKLSDGKVPFEGPKRDGEIVGATEEQLAVRDLRQQQHNEEMLGGAGLGIAPAKAEVSTAVRARQAAAMKSMETLDAFMREVHARDVNELIEKLFSMLDKGAAAKAQSESLEGRLVNLQDDMRGLAAERDAERLRIEGLQGADREQVDAMRGRVDQAAARLTRARRSMVRAEQGLSQVLMGVRLLARRIESIVAPEALPDGELDAATLIAIQSSRRSKRHLTTVAEDDTDGEAAVVEDLAGIDEVVEAVRESWERLEGRVRLVVETEWPSAPTSDPRLTESEIEEARKTRSQSYAGVGRASRPVLPGSDSRPDSAQTAESGPKEEGQDSPSEKPAPKLVKSAKSFNAQVLALVPSAPKPQDPNAAKILKTRSRLVKHQQEYKQDINVRIRLKSRGSDHSDEEEDSIPPG